MGDDRLTPDQAAETVKLGQTTTARVGKYQLSARIGSGGMGEVWKAWDTELRRWVALKFLKGGSPEEIARFRREAQTAAKLSHPNIAVVHEATDEFIAMQFIDGSDLKTHPPDGPRATVEAIRQAALALHYAHEQGVVHRDLKPANIMLSGAHAYVLDFGLAKSTRVDSRLSASGLLLGTPAYMSPEQARGVRDLDGRTDIYGLGATLYELLTGRPPFLGDDAYRLLKCIVEEDPQPVRSIRPQVNRDLETIVRKCLEKDPAQRYSTAQALARDLSRWLAGEAVLAHPPSAMYRLKKWTRRHAAVVIVGIAGLAVAGWASAKWMINERDLARERERAKSEAQARELARSPLAAGNKIVEQMLLRKSHFDYTSAEMRNLAQQAEEEFSKTFSFVPNHPEAHLGIGRAWAVAGDINRACAAFGESIAASPQFGIAYLEHARLHVSGYADDSHHSEERPDQAAPEGSKLKERIEYDLRQAERYAEKTPERQYAQGLLAFAREDMSQAEKLLGEYLKGSPADAPGQYWLGHCLVHLRKWDEAIEAFTRAIEYDARDSSAYNNRAIARENKGDYTKRG